MTEIKYWDNPFPFNKDNSAKKEQADKVRDINNNFNDKMFDLLTAASSKDPMFDIFDSDISDLFSDDDFGTDLESRLSDIKNEGMGKVWAAKMSNVLPFSDYDSGYGNDKDDNSLGGLNSIIELTVKMQMAQAKKALKRDQEDNAFMSINEFMGQEKVEKKDATDSNGEVSKDDFAKDMLAQIEAAAGKYDTSIDELKSLIFSEKA